MKTIIFDIDDTICETTVEWLKLFNSVANTNYSPDEWFLDHRFYHKHGIKIEDICEKVKTINLFDNLKVIKNALEVVNYFSYNGYYINYLTARGFYPNAYNVTYNWLIKNNFPVDNLFILPETKTKGQFLHNSNVDIVVEDNPYVVSELITLPNIKKVFLIDKPWSREFNELNNIRIPNIEKIMDNLIYK